MRRLYGGSEENRSIEDLIHLRNIAAAGETCVGIRREGSSYDFDLPDGVAVNVQDPACDAEWTIDIVSAMLRETFVTAAINPMASFKIILLAFISILAKPGYAASNECPANQETSCESLRSPGGYTYKLPPDISCAENSEQGWYFQNGTFIVDSTPNADGPRPSIVVDVTPQKLTLTVCENLQWQSDECHCVINYTVTDLKHSAAHDPQARNNTSGYDQDSNHDGNDLPAGVIALIVILVAGAFITILVIVIRAKCFHKPKQTDVL
ncbi:hypothetical protein ROHU_019506 [Labeo rohita]|uniref:Uncharacterized protein n=1 Tax=Labeo rohita TaxID=84645 RepID=A0A498N561_LABRO|nr:hypothetical protein ROHU_019506 [Labeo rohita]